MARGPADRCGNPDSHSLPTTISGGHSGNAVDLRDAVDVDYPDAAGDGELHSGIGLGRAVEDDHFGGDAELQRQPQFVMRDDLGAGAEAVQRLQDARVRGSHSRQRRGGRRHSPDTA